MTTHGAPSDSLWALARKTDPRTSHEAAKRAEPAAKSHAALILAELRRKGGQTSAELAQACGLERHEAARRCSDLDRHGLIYKGGARPCLVRTGAAVTWWARERSE